ncbi:hypothetical protein V2J09_000344 [Rumex salicifolius]
MAATVSSSVWGAKSKPGAWALEAEEHDNDLLREHESAAAAVHPEPPSADFPSLAAAAATKTKKKKPQTLSLAEFSTYSAPKATFSQRLTTDEILSLPTGPREHSAEELERSRNGFGGGGFRNYGYDAANSRSRVSDRGPGSRDRNSDDGFSRADEADDWSKSKMYVGSNGSSGDRREKVGFFNSSRADEVDNWASNKSFTPSEGRTGRRMGSDSFSSGGADSDNWGRKKEERDGSNLGTQRRGLGFESSGSSAADSENWLKNKDQNNPVAVNGGRPRLNLQRRTLPINNGGQEAKPKGSNPFGEARPREEVLKEKGQDWKEIDDKLEASKVKDVAADGAAAPSRKFGNVKEDLMEKRSWRKAETQAAPPASADNVEKEDGEKGEEIDAEKTVADNN